MPTTGILTNVLETILSVLAQGGEVVQSRASHLLQILIVIEISLSGIFWAITGHDVFKSLTKKILTIGFFIFLIQEYPTVLQYVVEGFKQTGKEAGTGLEAPLENPSRILDLGFTTGLPLLQSLANRLSQGPWGVLGGLTDIGMTFISWIILIFSFFLIALQVFLTRIEFAIVSTLGLILVPFGVLKQTSFLAEKVVGAVISFGVKLMVLAFIVSVTFPILSSLSVPTDSDWVNTFNVGFAALAIAVLAFHAPGVAAGLLSGSPSIGTGAILGAGSAIVSTAASVPALGAGAVALGSGVATGVGGVASAGASVARDIASKVGGISASFPGVAASGSNLANNEAGGARLSQSIQSAREYFEKRGSSASNGSESFESREVSNGTTSSERNSNGTSASDTFQFENEIKSNGRSEKSANEASPSVARRNEARQSPLGPKANGSEPVPASKETAAGRRENLPDEEATRIETASERRPNLKPLRPIREFNEQSNKFGRNKE